MDLMESFNKAKQEIYDHVGFKEDWTVYAIDDQTNMFWKIEGGEVRFAETVEKVDSDEGYSDEILTHRFYPKSIYRGKNLTLIMVDTNTDGNKFFSIYDNAKEMRSE